MVTRNYCDYCDNKISDLENRENIIYNNNGTLSVSCDGCKVLVDEIKDKYHEKFKVMGKNMDDEFRKLNKSPTKKPIKKIVKKKKWWRLWE